MTVNKELFPYNLMACLIGVCLAIFLLEGVSHVLHGSFLFFRRLLELPCG